MDSVISNKQSNSVIAYLEEQNAVVRSGRFWNCLAAARELSALLLGEGLSPWLARLRKAEARGDEVFHFPLIPRVEGLKATWTTHYVCCCDDVAYEPVVGRAMRLENYSAELFGEVIPMEVFIPSNELQNYLAEKLVSANIK